VSALRPIPFLAIDSRRQIFGDQLTEVTVLVALRNQPSSEATRTLPPFCTVRGFGGGLEAAAQDKVICAGER
jgi:hypothetical protein